MASERELQISPIVQESLVHNTRNDNQTLNNLHSLTASLLGVAAGILGLESLAGFAFYISFSLLAAALFYVLRVAPSSLPAGKSLGDTSRYFRRGGGFEFWTGGLLGGLAGYPPRSGEGAAPPPHRRAD
ncbi:hypothetical protein VTJ49DRAFT_7270 [Mycothermus thermophilus]|uniref:ER membrane protein complex subunit 6 n=1 Tax=Humicola insolens TaxID=85995 RepID=A0ABR3VHC7_HUMIN